MQVLLSLQVKEEKDLTTEKKDRTIQFYLREALINFSSQKMKMIRMPKTSVSSENSGQKK